MLTEGECVKAKETLIPRLDEPASNAPPSPAAASVVGISKRFGKASVLENISFDVAEGEVLVLLGARAVARRRSCASLPVWKCRTRAK